MQAETAAKRLKQVAEESRAEGHEGWGNTLDDVCAMLAGKVLCDSIAVDCHECSGDGYHWGSVNRVNKRIGCPVCNETGKLYAPASPLGNAFLAGNADIGKPEPDYKALYNELLCQVAIVVPGESRYQTALRYIREREDRRNAQEVGESTDIDKEKNNG